VSRIGLGRHGLIEEKAGDPLDGLVNLFDIGMILAVAFLIAGLTISVNPLGARHQRGDERVQARVVSPPAQARKAHGRGHPVGTAYRLADGRLVIVAPR
jgi:hypothetical protein